MDQRVEPSSVGEAGDRDSSTSTDQPARRGRRLVTLTIAGAIAVVIAAALYWHQQAPVAPAAQAPAPPPPIVTVANPVVQEIVEWDDYPGQFTAIETVEIRPQVSGYLESVHFSDGQMVKKGDLLYVIDKRPFEIALQSAKAQLAEAQAQARLAALELDRAKKLREDDVVSQSIYDDRLEALNAANAAVAAASASVRRAELDLEYTEIRSPLDGRIGRRMVDVGNLIQGGSNQNTMMASVVSLDPIHFTFNISEANFLAYQRAEAKGLLKTMRGKGVSSFVRLADETDWTHEGSIDFIDNAVDLSSGTITARGLFDNPNGLFTPGQFGRIRVPGSEQYSAILVPESAVLTDQSQKIVLTVEPDNKVGVRIVRLGPPYDGLRIVREGLKPEDRIIINGLTRARPGIEVTPEAGEIAATP